MHRHERENALDDPVASLEISLTYNVEGTTAIRVLPNLLNAKQSVRPNERRGWLINVIWRVGAVHVNATIPMVCEEDLLVDKLSLSRSKYGLVHQPIYNRILISVAGKFLASVHGTIPDRSLLIYRPEDNLWIVNIREVVFAPQ